MYFCGVLCSISVCHVVCLAKVFLWTLQLCYLSSKVFVILVSELFFCLLEDITTIMCVLWSVRLQCILV